MGITCKQAGKIRSNMRKLENELQKGKRLEKEVQKEGENNKGRREA